MLRQSQRLFEGPLTKPLNRIYYFYFFSSAIHWVDVPFTVLAIGMALVTAAIVFTLEWFFPWKEELFVSMTNFMESSHQD